MFGKKTPEQLEREVENLRIEGEVVSGQAQVAEKRAVIRQLEQQYGPRWKKILGLGGLPSLETLRSFLHTANTGMQKKAGSFVNPALTKSGSFGYKGKLLGNITDRR